LSDTGEIKYLWIHTDTNLWAVSERAPIEVVKFPQETEPIPGVEMRPTIENKPVKYIKQLGRQSRKTAADSRV
jgi:hypothetical protein